VNYKAYDATFDAFCKIYNVVVAYVLGYMLHFSHSNKIAKYKSIIVNFQVLRLLFL